MQETQQYSLEQTSKVIADYLGNTIKEYFPLFINENSLPVHYAGMEVLFWGVRMVLLNFRKN